MKWGLGREEALGGYPEGRTTGFWTKRPFLGAFEGELAFLRQCDVETEEGEGRSLGVKPDVRSQSQSRIRVREPVVSRRRSLWT